MKSINKISIGLLNILWLLPFKVLAADNRILENLKKVGKIGFGAETPTDPKLIIANIIQVVIGFVGIIFLILIIVGGVQWMTSGGNQETVKKAKGTIASSTIGLLIVLLSYAIAFSVSYWLNQATSGGTGVTPYP